MTLGNKATISFDLSNFEGELLRINFYLGNKLISNQLVFLPSYVASLERFIDLVTDRTYRNERLNVSTPSELLDTIEAQQTNDDTLFFKHLFQLDETIDPYFIFIFEHGGQTTFIWKCWDKHNCNAEHELNRKYTVAIPTSELLSTLHQLASELKKR